MSVTFPRPVAICASGAGTNAHAILQYQHEHANCAYAVALIVSSRASAGVREVAQRWNVPCVVQTATAHDEAANASELLSAFRKADIELVCLAGYMRKVPEQVCRAYSGRIVNIHPALLPKFGGQGMYGENVFRAVLEAGEEESGATVHLVDAEYDRGEILDQIRFPIEQNEQIQSLALKTHQAEHELYPKVLQSLALELGSKGL